jgi:broad specificity phosphatase PhoE
MRQVRHGTSEWNLLKKWQGTVDTQLAPEGVAQARSRALDLAASGVRFDACATSDLKRASATAELLVGACKARAGVAPVADGRLRECPLGEFEGQTKEAIYGPKYAGLWAHLGGLPHESRLRTPYFDGLETPLQVGTRAGCALVDLALACPQGPHGGTAHGGTALAVTHSTVIESLLASLFGADFDAIDSKNLGWLRFEVRPVRAPSGEPLGWRLVLTGSEGIAFRSSPDAVVHDAEACRRLGAGAGQKGLVTVAALEASRRAPQGAAGAAASSEPSSRRWLVATIGAALAMSVAGIAKVHASGGKLGASPPSPGGGGVGGPVLEPFWGPVSASVDWCEDNYAWAGRWVAEPLNSASSLALVAAGWWAASQASRAGAERRYTWLGWALAVVGVGSLAYHATLRKAEQALDEVPMLWLALLADYCVLQGDFAPATTYAAAAVGDAAKNDGGGGAAGDAGGQGAVLPVPLPAPALGGRGPFGPALGMALGTWACVVSYLQWATTESWQPLAFHLSFVSAEVQSRGVALGGGGAGGLLVVGTSNHQSADPSSRCPLHVALCTSLCAPDSSCSCTGRGGSTAAATTHASRPSLSG